MVTGNERIHRRVFALLDQWWRTWEACTPFIEVAVDAPAEPPAVQWPFDAAPPMAHTGHADLVYTFHGSDCSGLWLINGEQFPYSTIETISTINRNTQPIVEVRNISASHHPLHIHGMRFEMLSINGEPVQSRQIEDTIDVSIRDRIRMALYPRETDEWMLHCNILPHADDGMMTVLRVE